MAVKRVDDDGTTVMQARALPAFGLIDMMRRAQGDALAMLGLGPSECDYRVFAAQPQWRLREYSDPHTPPSLLIVSAPIKRPYVWDLSRAVSTVRYCLQHQLSVYLLEWSPATRDLANRGIDEYAAAIVDCVARVKERSGQKPFLIGHSLGGTLAAIAAALEPKSIRGLLLLGAPLCFQPAVSRFADAIASMDSSALSKAEVVPGSLLSEIAVLASPETFVWSRLTDAAVSLADPVAMDIHARVERWALDEAPLPGRLVNQIFRWLYREDRLRQGTLSIDGKAIGPANLAAPTLAIANTADDIAPPASVKPFLDAMPTRDVHLIEYPGETGVALQHLAVLLGRQARAQVWPQIVAWLKSRH